MPSGATGTDSARVAAARRWFRLQGQTAVERDGVTTVTTTAHCDVWDANFVLAGPEVGPDAVFMALETFAPWQVVQVDCLTPPAVEAALALAGFVAQGAVIEMVATAVASPRPVPAVELVAVDDANWPVFAALVAADHREGKRTGALGDGVGAGLLDLMRRRRATCDFWLLVADGVAAGYGMTVACPNGLGLIESLFTLPAHRGQGLMSAFIVAAAAKLRAAGCDAVFLDAHAHDTPKHLYERLGFAPVAVTRTWARRAV